MEINFSRADFEHFIVMDNQVHAWSQGSHAPNCTRGAEYWVPTPPGPYSTYYKRQDRGATGLAAVLGTDKNVPTKSHTRCAALGEQRVFETECAARIVAMNSALHDTRWRRGLLIEYTGSNTWGWGHAMAAVYALHFLCQLLKRFCYLKLYDLSLGAFFHYANGNSWEADPDELARYDARKVLRLRTTFATKRSVLTFMQHVSNSSAPLVHVILDSQLLTRSEVWLPLRLALRVGVGTNMTSQLDRCFCRYVTQPAKWLPEMFHSQRGSAASVHGFDTAIHLRTGFADVGWDFSNSIGSRASLSSFSATARWFEQACNPSAFAKQRWFIMSDSPKLLAHLHARFADRVGSNYPHVERLASGTTRSWNSSFDSKLALALDFFAGGLVREVQHDWTSNLVRPLVARSVCVRRVVELHRGACPRFSRVFVRSLFQALESAHYCHSVGNGRAALSSPRQLMHEALLFHKRCLARSSGCLTLGFAVQRCTHRQRMYHCLSAHLPADHPCRALGRGPPFGMPMGECHSRWQDAVGR